MMPVLIFYCNFFQSLGPDSTANSISKAIQDGIRNQSTTAAVSGEITINLHCYSD